MSAEPVVTILMSTYGRRDYLPTALASVCAQTFRDWRLLVVNDGGPDVADLIAACPDDRIAYFNRPHLGKAAQMNFLMPKVTGKYVAYMDDDDEMLPNHLACLVGAAEENAAEFVYSDLKRRFIGPDGRVLRESVPASPDVGYEDLRIFNSIGHPQILHTKALADRVGPYDERFRILIDFDYIKRLTRQARPFHVHQVTYLYLIRVRSASVDDTNSVSGLWRNDPAAAGRTLLAFFEKDPEALARLYRMCDALRGERDYMANSPYWKLTAPLRGLVHFLKRIARRR